MQCPHCNPDEASSSSKSLTSGLQLLVQNYWDVKVLISSHRKPFLSTMRSLRVPFFRAAVPSGLVSASYICCSHTGNVMRLLGHTMCLNGSGTICLKTCAIISIPSRFANYVCCLDELTSDGQQGNNNTAACFMKRKSRLWALVIVELVCAAWESVAQRVRHATAIGRNGTAPSE